MTRGIQGDLGNLIHGVSRQPDSRKFKGQCREQLNCRSNLTRGLESRAGFEHVAILQRGDKNPLNDTHWEVSERGDGTVVFFQYDTDRPHIFELNNLTAGIIGESDFKFTNQAASDYYTTGTNPKVDFGITSILDTTFVTNNKVIPTGNDGTDEIDPVVFRSWLEFKTFNQGVEIDIEFGGIAAQDPDSPDVHEHYRHAVFDGFVKVNPDNGQPDRNQSERTREYDGSWHAEQIKIFLDGLTAQGVGNVYKFNNWLLLEEDAAYNINIIGGGESIKLYHSNDFKAIEDLPEVGEDAMVVKVVEGDGADKNTGYFRATRTEGDGGGFGKVSWAETIAPNSIGVLSPATMPHTLTQPIADSDQWQFGPYDWDHRKAGDKETNPYPTFITDGVPISSVGIFQNRLSLTANESVHLSATDEYGDFWLQSAYFNADDDPLEVYADTDKLNIIKFAAQFDSDLILLSDNAQLIMSGEIKHTYQNATVDVATQFQADLYAKPVMAGDSLFFTFDYGSFAGVREFFTDSYAATKRSEPVTEHVDDYITGRIRQMTASTNINALVSLTESDRQTAYLYEWKTNSARTEYLQRSWSKWELQQDKDESFNFQWVGFIQSELYAIIRYRNSLYGYDETLLWKLTWDDPPTSHGLPFAVRLDGRKEVPKEDISYNAVADETRILLPFGSAQMMAIQGSASDAAGLPLNTWYSDEGASKYLVCQGDFTGMSIIVGMPYIQEYDMAIPFVRDQSGAALQTHRLQFNRFFLHFSALNESMEFIIRDEQGRERVESFGNRRTNRIANQPSKVPYEGDTWPIAVRKRARGISFRIRSTSYVPFTLEAIEWWGQHNQRGRRTS